VYVDLYSAYSKQISNALGTFCRQYLVKMWLRLTFETGFNRLSTEVDHLDVYYCNQPHTSTQPSILVCVNTVATQYPFGRRLAATCWRNLWLVGWLIGWARF